LCFQWFGNGLRIAMVILRTRREDGMKLRLNHDSIRLRFTQPEAKALGEGVVLTDKVSIGPLEEQSLSYRVVPNGAEGIRVGFIDHTISVYVPKTVLASWYEGEDVAVEATQAWNGGKVRILLEKDLQRLNPKPAEEPQGVYSHPLFGKKHCEHP
jgi:hypothetical protein